MGSAWEVVGHGIGSQNSTDVALRMGVGDLLVSFPSNTIPASGSTPVSVEAPSGLSRIFVSNVWVNGVYGRLERDQSLVGHWTFTRAWAGDQLTLPGSVRAEIADSVDAAASGYIWVGRNNPTDTDRILADVAAMWARHAQLSDEPMWVLGLTPAHDEVVGTREYTLRHQLNSALRATYGPRYVPIDEYLVNNALADLGLAPTAQDRLDAQRGVVPSSLMMPDGLHMNDLGRRAVAGYVAAFVSSADTSYLTSFDPQADLAIVGDGHAEVSVVGWAFDKGDIGRSLNVSVSVDGRQVDVVQAVHASDYLRAYGVWGSHAFVDVVHLGPGRHEVCIEAENVLDGRPTVVCRQAVGGAQTQENVSPQGDVLVSAPAESGMVRVLGWAFDHSDVPASIPVDVALDGRWVRRVTASMPSEYLYPYGVPGAHAFLVGIAASDGPHDVCVTAVNQGPGHHVRLGCTRVRVTSAPADPGGDITMVMGSADASVALDGYAYDPSSWLAPVRVAVFADDVLVASPEAQAAWPSLASYGIPGWHGLHSRVALRAGSRRMCALALNIGPGSHTWLRCTRVSTAVVSPLVSLAAEEDVDGTIKIDGWAFDFSNQSQPLTVVIEVDGQSVGYLTASGRRSELSWMMGWEGDHGFEYWLRADPRRSHMVCATAVNIGAAAPSTRQCVQYAPFHR